MSGPKIFTAIEAPATAELVRQQIEGLIREGVLRPGARLPAERDLARLMGVSRPVIRQALKEMETTGLIHTNYGGGTFVTNALGSLFVDPLVALLASDARTYTDYLEYRTELEGAAAERAARRATRHDLEILETVFSEMVHAHEADDADREASLDIQFHMAIVDASHNAVFSTISRAMYGLLWRGITESRKRICTRAEVRKNLFGQHQAILESILAGDAAGARRAMVEHLDFVVEHYAEAEAILRREAVAAKRLTALQDGLRQLAEGSGVVDRSG